MDKPARTAITPTGREVGFDDEDIIVSKTNLKGHITYVNRVFMEIAGYEEHELLGQPHNIIRHPDMPRSIFRFLWDAIASGEEIFAYVKNMTKSGDHYWVFAHVTPTVGNDGKIVGYHSNRRVSERTAIERIEPIYQALIAEEARHSSRKDGIAAAVGKLAATLDSKGMAYDEFVFSL